MISIVVPVLDEEAEIGPALRRLLRLQERPGEVIVADGGSRDATAAVALDQGARVVWSAPGRGRQMNAGAEAARGDVLLFLHVDTRLPDRALAAVRAALEDGDVVGGGFCKRYLGGRLGLAVLAALQNRLRSRAAGRLVGTQALFVRRATFTALGGFPDWPLLEDVAFSDRLRRAGKVAVLAGPVHVSARRYRARGVLRQAAANALVLALFRLGVPPSRLVRLYRGGRDVPSHTTPDRAAVRPGTRPAGSGRVPE